MSNMQPIPKSLERRHASQVNRMASDFANQLRAPLRDYLFSKVASELAVSGPTAGEALDDALEVASLEDAILAIAAQTKAVKHVR